MITVLFLLIFFSCKKKENEIKNTYQIISLIYTDILNSLDTPVPLPGPPPKLEGNFSQNYLDSIDLAYLKLTKKLISKSVKKGFKNIRKKIAICPKLNNLNNLNFQFNEKHQKFKILFDNYKSTKEIENIDISKIYTNRNDSIIYYRDSLLNKESREFYKFDALISFSRIIFNKNYNNAIIICSLSLSKLASASSIYFLEKTKNDRWIIKYVKELTIS